MSDITDAFSPPYVYLMFDGRSISFKRMLSRQWSELINQIRAERLEAAMIDITKELDGKPWQERQAARLDAQHQIRGQTTIKSVMYYVVNDTDGIERLLKFAALQLGASEADWEGSKEKAGIKDMIPPIDKVMIADEVTYKPIVPPARANPTEPGAESTDAGKTQTPAKPTGEESPVTPDGSPAEILAT